LKKALFPLKPTSQPVVEVTFGKHVRFGLRDLSPVRTTNLGVAEAGQQRHNHVSIIWYCILNEKYHNLCLSNLNRAIAGRTVIELCGVNFDDAGSSGAGDVYRVISGPGVNYDEVNLAPSLLARERIDHDPKQRSTVLGRND
jgi:hypothetical protein